MRDEEMNKMFVCLISCFDSLCSRLSYKQMLISYFYVIVHESAGVRKVRVLSVDVGQLDGNQVVNLKRNSENGFIRLVSE